MIPRAFLRLLVLAMPVLVVAFAVLLGASTLIQAIGDEPAAGIVRWVAAGVLLLAATDLLLLVMVLGLKALGESEAGPGDSEQRGD